MSDFDRLSRGGYGANGARRASEQEACELSRGSFHPDAVRKAAEQEAYEFEEERAVSRGSRATTSGREIASDRPRANHTVVRRPTPGQEEPSGGAVVSKRSRLGMAMRRKVREERGRGSDPVRSAERRRRRAERVTRRQNRGEGRGSLTPLLLVIAAIVAIYLVVFSPVDRSIALPKEEREGLSQELKGHVPGMPYYVLALGSDARKSDTVSRSDTMILVRVDPLGGKLTMLSIPRDTMVEIEGYGTQKINAAYAFGGAACAVHEVSELTGVPISHVAVIKFDGIEGLVDALGGVTVNVPVAVYDPYYTGLELPAGEQEMDGHTALLFSRVRHGFELGDYQRQIDQRILIKAIMDKALSLGPTKLPSVLGSMNGLLGTTMRCYSIVPLMLRLKIGGATVYQATVPSDTAMVDGVSYVIADDEALAEMMAVIDAGGDPSTLS